MEHIPTQESDVQKVIRIARELGISLEDAAVTCAGFELAFSDDILRREIFEIIHRLDDEAYKKGEPMGLIISYAVELRSGGIRVGRYADEIPPGVVVTLTPTDRAMIFLKIKDNFPTQQFLGPIIMNRPEWEFESKDQCPAESEIQNPISKIDNGVVSSDKSKIPNPKSKIDRVVCSDDSKIRVKLPSLDKEGCPLGRGGLTDRETCDTGSAPEAVATGVVSSDKSKIQNPKSKIDYGLVSSDSEMKESAIPLGPSSLEPAREPICLGPIRLKFNERFPCVSAARSSFQRVVLPARMPAFQKALKPPHHLPPWALPAEMPAFQWTSGLSPPLNAENLGHSERKMFLRHRQ